MNEYSTERENKRKGLIISVVFHTLVIALAALLGFSYQVPPPEPGGILVNLGIPDVGQGNENAPPQAEAKPVEKPKPTPPEPVTPPPAEPKPTVKEPVPKKEVKTTQDPNAEAIRKQKEEEARRKAEEERKRTEAEAERKRQEELQRQREEEARRLKEQLSGGGLKGSGEGKGKTGSSGNQGDPSGDPNSNVLSGISTGSGVVGGGLSGRGVVKRGPRITDNSQEQGTVMLDVCVDRDGNVISAEYKLKGSTTADTRLINLAIQNAKQWKFAPGNVDKQCGTIRYDFKLQ